MASQIHWVSKGSLQPAPVGLTGAPLDERELLHRQGFVKIVQDGVGTTVKWAMFTSNWASLYFALEWIHCSNGPFHLHYYSAGWFNERFETAWEAADRMTQLIYKSDIHLSRTVYIHEANDARDDLPQLLKSALRDNDIDEDHSIDCIYDASSHKFRVTRVGNQSTIAKLWGMNPVSYPCLTGHSYDQAVSRIYPEVSRTGEPHYDHIYAAMTSPTGDIVWVPYQRVVLPLRINRTRKGVRIVTELTKVDISPL
jgi:hypothetical protein